MRCRISARWEEPGASLLFVAGFGLGGSFLQIRAYNTAYNHHEIRQKRNG